MNITLNNKETTQQYSFDLEYEGYKYNVVIHTNSKGKFIDTDIWGFDAKCHQIEPTEEQREEIIEYIDAHWSELTGE